MKVLKICKKKNKTLCCFVSGNILNIYRYVRCCTCIVFAVLYSVWWVYETCEKCDTVCAVLSNSCT